MNDDKPILLPSHLDSPQTLAVFLDTAANALKNAAYEARAEIPGWRYTALEWIGHAIRDAAAVVAAVSAQRGEDDSPDTPPSSPPAETPSPDQDDSTKIRRR